jgi:hypothetical protein
MTGLSQLKVNVETEIRRQNLLHDKSAQCDTIKQMRSVPCGLRRMFCMPELLMLMRVHCLSYYQLDVLCMHAYTRLIVTWALPVAQSSQRRQSPHRHVSTRGCSSKINSPAPLDDLNKILLGVENPNVWWWKLQVDCNAYDLFSTNRWCKIHGNFPFSVRVSPTRLLLNLASYIHIGCN